MRSTLREFLGKIFLWKWDKHEKVLLQSPAWNTRVRIWCLVLWQPSWNHEGRHHCCAGDARTKRQRFWVLDGIFEWLHKPWDCPHPNFLSGVINVRVMLLSIDTCIWSCLNWYNTLDPGNCLFGPSSIEILKCLQDTTQTLLLADLSLTTADHTDLLLYRTSELALNICPIV